MALGDDPYGEAIQIVAFNLSAEIFGRLMAKGLFSRDDGDAVIDKLLVIVEGLPDSPGAREARQLVEKLRVALPSRTPDDR